ncbi:MAG: type IV pilus modification PilV family protein [Solirubrobacterales bacterium]
MSWIHARMAIRGEGGFTLVEIMVAAFVLLVAGFGALQVLITSSKVNYRAEQAQTAIERAQAEMEAIRALSHEEVAMTGPPGTSADADDPRARVSTACTGQGVSLNGCFAVERDGGSEAPLVVNGGALEDGGAVSGGAINPNPESFTTGDVSGTIHRFVVWRNDPGCVSTLCAGTQDFKRVVVAVELDDGSTGSRTYREIQSDFTDPDAGQDSEPTPEVTEETIAQELYLSDTPCDRDVRLLPTADHPAHNNLGQCSNGLSTNSSPGAPDLLTTGQPSNQGCEPPGCTLPLWDYSDNYEPVEGLAGPGEDKGRQLLPKANLLTCDFDLLEGLTDVAGINIGHKYVARWVTEPIPTDTGSGSGFVINGDAVLELNTRKMRGLTSVNPLGATVCVQLFIRDEATGIDTPLKNGVNGNEYFRFSHTNWPGEFNERSIPMDLQDPVTGSEVITVPPGKRLGMSLAVDLVNIAPTTLDPFISFMYEHPDYESRLQVETTTPYEGSLTTPG